MTLVTVSATTICVLRGTVSGGRWSALQLLLKWIFNDRLLAAHGITRLGKQTAVFNNVARITWV